MANQHFDLPAVNERYCWRTPSTSWRVRHDPAVDFPEPDFYMAGKPYWLAKTLDAFDRRLVAQSSSRAA